MLNGTVFIMFAAMLYVPAPLYMDTAAVAAGTFVIAALVLCGIGSQATEYYWRRSFVATVFTARETDHANAMLYQMLPAAVANQLKEGRTGVSDYFEGVSILFCDIRDFTAMCQRITPLQVVHLLNQLFSAFDILTDKYSAFKVQTIGDCYVIVVGLPYRMRAISRPFARGSSPAGRRMGRCSCPALLTVTNSTGSETRPSTALDRYGSTSMGWPEVKRRAAWPRTLQPW